MKKIGYACVALSALFVLDGYGAGISDWKMSAREQLEEFAKNTLLMTNLTNDLKVQQIQDAEDTNKRWNDSEAGNADIQLVINGAANSGDWGSLKISDATVSFTEDHLAQSGEKQLGRFKYKFVSLSDKSDWKILTISKAGRTVLELSFYLPQKEKKVNTIVINKISLGKDVSFSAKAQNILLADNNSKYKKAIFATPGGSFLGVGSNFGKNDSVIFSHNALIYDKNPAEQDSLKQLGQFFSRCSKWLDTFRKNREILVSLDTEYVTAEDVDMRFIDASNIGELNEKNCNESFESPQSVNSNNFYEQTGALENIRRYFNPVFERKVKIKNDEYILAGDDPILLALHGELCAYKDNLEGAPKLFSIVEYSKGVSKFAFYNLGEKIEIKPDTPRLEKQSTIGTRKSNVLDSASFIRSSGKTILKHKGNTTFGENGSTELVVEFGVAKDKEYGFFYNKQMVSWLVNAVLQSQLNQLQTSDINIDDYARADEVPDDNSGVAPLPNTATNKPTGEGDEKSAKSLEEKMEVFGGRK